MKIVEIKDYAYPCMMAEKSIKNVYYLMITNKPNQAITECISAIQAFQATITIIQNAKIKTS